MFTRKSEQYIVIAVPNQVMGFDVLVYKDIDNRFVYCQFYLMDNHALFHRMAPTRRPRKKAPTRKSTRSTRLLSAAADMRMTSVPFEDTEEMQDIRRTQSSTSASTAGPSDNEAWQKTMERRMDATDKLMHNMQALLQSVAKPANVANEHQHSAVQEATITMPKTARQMVEPPWPSYNQGANLTQVTR